MPCLDIDTTRIVAFLKNAASWLFGSQIMKRWTLTNYTELMLANTGIFLPLNQLTGHARRG